MRETSRAIDKKLWVNNNLDSSVYGAAVRLANDSVMLPLIDGKGAFGTITSNFIEEASSRYTEMRLSSVTQEFFKGINKGNVEMVNNYDDTLLEPKYLPTTFPTVLANPSLGIAVGIASKICSFNLEDICNNTIKAINNEEMDIMIPDFPTGAEILNDKQVLKNIHETGRGTLTLQSVYHFEGDNIIVTEIPYLATREEIIDKVIELVKDGKLKDIIDIADHSGNKGLNITIKCRKGANKESLIKQLFKQTSLQKNYGCNFNVLHNGKPKTMGVKQIINAWIEFRTNTIKREIENDIKTKENKLNILFGLEKILLDIDKAVEIIRFADNPKNSLMEYFNINEEQSNYILDVKLKNINSIYINKQIKDINDLREQVEFLKNNKENKEYINSIMIDDLNRVKNNYSQPRKTKVIDISRLKTNGISKIVEDYNCNIMVTKQGWIKKYSKASDNQKIKDGDEILQNNIKSNNKHTLFLFTNKANRYKLPVDDLELKTPSTYGQYIPSLIDLEEDEQIIYVCSITDNPKGYIFTVYKNGLLSKVPIGSFMSANRKLVNCYSNKSELIEIGYFEGDVDVLLISTEGKGIIGNTKNINPKSTRSSGGVRGIKLSDDNAVIYSKLNVPRNHWIVLEDSKEHTKELMLEDAYDDNRDYYKYLTIKLGNQGNFILNTRNYKNSKIISVKVVDK